MDRLVILYYSGTFKYIENKCSRPKKSSSVDPSIVLTGDVNLF